eukprot:1484426-Lingulodinium_polyedra.AAC.1
MSLPINSAAPDNVNCRSPPFLPDVASAVGDAPACAARFAQRLREISVQKMSSRGAARARAASAIE